MNAYLRGARGRGGRGAPSARRAARAGLSAVFVMVAAVILAACSPSTTTGHTANAGTAAAAVGVAAPSPTAGAATAATPAFPFTLTGTDGHAVQLSKPPQRIISLSPGTTETLFAIGAGGAVVADDRFSDYPEAAKALPKVEYTRPGIESLTALKPDLIITALQQQDTLPAIEAAGLPVVLLEEPAALAGVIDRVRLLGRVTGHVTEAETVAAGMEQRISAVTQKLSGVTRGPRVYHELDPALFTVTPRSFVGDLYTLLKAQNIAQGGTNPYPQLSQEVIVQRDPEVIVLADAREGVTPDQVRDRPGWGQISAVRTGRVYALPAEQADVVSRPGPRVVDGLEQLAKLLYPERF